MVTIMRKWYTIQKGERFHRWTILERGEIFCSCRCDCGYVTNVRINNILRNKSRQCRSCSITSRNQQISRWEGSDEEYPPRLRAAVKNAILRCTNPSHAQYYRYGGRGITVFEPWVKNRRLFVKYLMSLDGWNNESLWLDRIDNDGNYEPGNLRWTTPSISRINSHRDD